MSSSWPGKAEGILAPDYCTPSPPHSPLKEDLGPEARVPPATRKDLGPETGVPSLWTDKKN